MTKAETDDGRKLYRVDGIGMAILHRLWSAAEGLTIRDIFDKLYAAEDVSFCTVQTTIRRMETAGTIKKGKRLKGSRADLYVAARSQEDECASVINGVMTAFFGGKPSKAAQGRINAAVAKMPSAMPPKLRGQ